VLGRVREACGSLDVAGVMLEGNKWKVWGQLRDAGTLSNRN